VEGVIGIVKAGATRNDLGRKAKEQLLTANADIIGIVINSMKTDSEDYQYYYYYYAQDNKASNKAHFFNFLLK
jgi:Mrp family chromosome partitioning ATPase